MVETAEKHEPQISEPEITREGRTIVDARDLLEDKAVLSFIRRLSESIKDKKSRTETDRHSTSE